MQLLHRGDSFHVKRLASASVALVLVAALVGLLREGETAVAKRPATAGPEGGGRTLLAPGIVETEVRVSSSGARTSESGGGAAHLAESLSAIGATARDQAEIEAELVAAPRSELVAMRPQLEDLLRRSPALAPGVARAFARLDDRESLFVVSRALVLCPDDASVREALVAGAEGSHAARREVSLLALGSTRDERAIDLARTALEDTSASPRVRAAGAWALAHDAERAPSSAFAAARSLAGTQAEDAHLRAEALHLLATRTATRAPDAQDRALAASTLSEPAASPELALAAARLALEAGEDRATVARALAGRNDPGGLRARAARALQEAP